MSSLPPPPHEGTAYIYLKRDTGDSGEIIKESLKKQKVPSREEKVEVLFFSSRFCFKHKYKPSSKELVPEVPAGSCDRERRWHRQHGAESGHAGVWVSDLH